MAAKRKSLVVVFVVLALLAFGIGWWLNHVPEPEFNGRGLGDYIANARDENEVTLVVSQLGARAVPYLAYSIKRDPIREFIYSTAQKQGLSLKFLQDDLRKYRTRRMRASYQLANLGTNAATALPAVLPLVESLDDHVFYSGMALLKFAPGTEHELRALNALLRIIALDRIKEWLSDKYAIQHAYELLPAFTSQLDIVVPVLVRSLSEPGGYKRIDAVVQLGTNALPALREAALSETNHVRPATVAWERILAGEAARTRPVQISIGPPRYSTPPNAQPLVRHRTITTAK